MRKCWVSSVYQAWRGSCVCALAGVGDPSTESAASSASARRDQLRTRGSIAAELEFFAHHDAVLGLSVFDLAQTHRARTKDGDDG